MKKIRLPEAFIGLPALACALIAVIAGGVAVTQGPNGDWRLSLGALGALVVCGAVYKLAPVDWIRDKELESIESDERMAEFDKELGDGTFEAKSRRRDRLFLLAVLAVVGLQKAMTYGVFDPAGRDGATLGGKTFGTFHVLGRDWTGVELVFVSALLVYLAWTLRGGFSTLRKAQKKPVTRD